MVNLGMIEEAYDHLKELSNKIEIEEFNKAIEPDLNLLNYKENDILLLNYAAFSASINKNYPSAIDYFKRIVKLDPENIWIQNYLAATQIELKQYNEAKIVLKQVIKIKDNKYSHFLLGIYYFKKGKLIKALVEINHSGNLINKFLVK